MPDIFTQQESWDDWSNVKSLIVDRIISHRLVVVLGAGASVGCGLPNWTKLIDNCYQIHGINRIPGQDDNQASEHLLTNVLENDEKAFAELVQKALYLNLDEKFALDSPLLQAIGALVMLTARKRTGTVLTYNFDDLLETYLRHRGFFACPIIQQPCWYQSEDVTVLHPHGFLSRYESFRSSNDLTFTRLHFDNQTGIASNPWRQKTVDTYERNMPLFIGLSGQDPNLRSALAEVKGKHASFSDGHLFWGVRICTKDDPEISTWENRGILCKKVDSHSDIPTLLMDICYAGANELLKRRQQN